MLLNTAVADIPLNLPYFTAVFNKITKDAITPAQYSLIHTTPGNKTILGAIIDNETSNQPKITVTAPVPGKDKIPTHIHIAKKGNKVIVTLTDVFGNVLANKHITVRIGSQVFSGTTNANGQLIIQYKNADRYTITASFRGDAKYGPSTATVGGVNPTNPTNPAMKSTGVPILALLLVLISSLGIFSYRKKE